MKYALVENSLLHRSSVVRLLLNKVDFKKRVDRYKFKEIAQPYIKNSDVMISYKLVDLLEV